MLVCQVLTILLLWFTAVATAQKSTKTVETHAKIVGGHSIDIADAPYQVSVRLRILHNYQFGLGHICGGTVISQRVICSAAHCFAINNTKVPMEYKQPEFFVIVAGGSYVNKIDYFTMELLIQQLIGHERFRLRTMENDIALLFLNVRIPWDWPTVRQLPLTPGPYPPNTLCLVSGWGNRKSHLQQAMVPVVDSRVCSIMYMQMPITQMCAGYLRGGPDACIGDSGGPLVCNGTLTGIISWGVDCGRLFFPGVYTNVSHYINWIARINASLNYSRFLEVRSLNGVSKTVSHYPFLYLISGTLLTIILKIKSIKIFCWPSFF